MSSERNMMYISGQVRCKLQVVGYPTSSENDMNKWFKIGPAFLPTLRKFCILFNCQTLQTEQTELNQTLPNGGR